MAGDTYRLVATGEQTQGKFAVIDMLVPPGGGPGPHAHAQFQETFHVVEGEVVVKSEQGTFIASHGMFVGIPTGGIVHSFKNESRSVARLWCVVIPAGLDAFFQEIGQPVEPGQFLPAPELTAEEQQRLQTIAEKYGVRIYPPDHLR